MAKSAEILCPIVSVAQQPFVYQTLPPSSFCELLPFFFEIPDPYSVSLAQDDILMWALNTGLLMSGLPASGLTASVDIPHPKRPAGEQRTQMWIIPPYL